MDTKQYMKYLVLEKILKFTVIGIAIIVLVSFIVILSTKDSIIAQYENLNQKPVQTKSLFQDKYIEATTNDNGKTTLKFVATLTQSYMDRMGLQINTNGTYDGDPESGTPWDGGDPDPSPYDPGPTPGGVSLSSNLRDAMARFRGEDGTAIGYIGVLTTAYNRIIKAGLDPNDPASWDAIGSAPMQYTGWDPKYTYENIDSVIQGAIDSFISGTRPNWGSNLSEVRYFKGGSGYNLFATPGTVIFRNRAGGNYFYAGDASLMAANNIYNSDYKNEKGKERRLLWTRKTETDRYAGKWTDLGDGWECLQVP